MPDLGIALNTVISGLNVNQQALSIISSNIANANSENYSRREIVQSSQVVNGIASGVQIEEVRRAVDEFVVSSARRQISNVGRYEIQAQFYDRLELYLGQPGTTSNIASQFDGFFARLGELSNSPEQSSLRTNTLEGAIALTSSVSGLARNIQTLRFDVDQAIDQQVDDINAHLDALFSLNLSIKNVSIGGGDKTALYDARDKELSDLSKIMDVNVSFASDGSVTVFLAQTELLSPTSQFDLSYTPASSVDSIIGGASFNAIKVQLLDSSGNPTGQTVDLAPASNDTTHDLLFTSGSLKGLLEMRDAELPNLLDQLDRLASTFADAFNAVHNDGAGFPPAASLTGTRLMSQTEDYNFSGSARIAVLNSNGSPVANSLGGGLPPLTLDFGAMSSTGSPGEVDLATIVREINQYFGPPPSTIASMGPLQDIRIASVSDNIDSTHAVGNMVFSANLGVGDQVIIDGTTYTMVANGTASNGLNIELGTSQAATMQNIAAWLNASQLSNVAAATYSATGANTLTITHRTAGTAPNAAFDLAVNFGGGRTASINGGAAAAAAAGTLGVGASAIAGVNANGTFTFDFEMTNISGGNASFEVLDIDLGAGSTGLTMGPFTSASGLRQRTNLGGATNGQNISITIPAGLQEGDTFNVTATVRVTDSNGTITNDTITFTVTVPDPTEDITSRRSIATAVGTGDATIATPTNTTRFATARIVDANGNVVTNGGSGYLQIISNRSGTGIVMDELDSTEGGTIASPTATATGRGFSHFFGLNDFFTTGSSLDGSAVNFAVRSGYRTDPSRLATAELVRSNQPSDPDANPVFTYEIGIGSNQLATRLGELKTSRQVFDAAGGLPAATLTFAGYSSEILSFAALSNNRIDAALEQEQTLYNAFQERIDSTGGINVDEELANTVLFQNNFNATARLITIISEMLDKMIESF